MINLDEQGPHPSWGSIASTVLLKNNNERQLWVTVLTDPPPNRRRDYDYLFTTLLPGQSQLLAVKGRVKLGLSPAKVENGCYKISYRVAVFATKPVKGQEPDWIERLHVKARADSLAPRGTTLKAEVRFLLEPQYILPFTPQ